MSDNTELRDDRSDYPHAARWNADDQTPIAREMRAMLDEIARLRAELADPVRRRREAIGAWVEVNEPVTTGAYHHFEGSWAYRDKALAAGESAVSEVEGR